MSKSLSRPVTTRPCPICHSDRVRELFHQSFEGLSGIDFVAGYDVVVCSKCGVAFADGIPSQSVLDAYYRDVSKYEFAHHDGQVSELDDRRFREIGATIANVVPSAQARILEIGCATGHLLSLLREAGFAAVQGLDPSPGCARAAWDRYRIPVLVSSLFDIPTAPESFDFVIAIGVLEHVEDLHGALRRVRTTLSASGCVYAEVPDAAHLAGRPDAPYQEFSTEHINFFSTVSLTNLFTSNGFQVVSTGECIRQQHDNTMYPAAFGIYRKVADRAPVVRDDVTEPGLRRYIEESSQVDTQLRKTIEHAAGQGPVLIWGTGTHTQRLLATGAFDKISIAGFVDSNPKYQGRTLRGIPILSPSSLIGRPERILISTRGFQQEIRDQIQHDLGLSNQVMLLYDDK